MFTNSMFGYCVCVHINVSLLHFCMYISVCACFFVCVSHHLSVTVQLSCGRSLSLTTDPLLHKRTAASDLTTPNYQSPSLSLPHPPPISHFPSIPLPLSLTTNPSPYSLPLNTTTTYHHYPSTYYDSYLSLSSLPLPITH